MMLELFAAIGLVALALIWVALQGEESNKPFLIAGGILLILLGGFVGVEGVAPSPVLELPINYTGSYNGFCNVTNLFEDENEYLAHNVSCLDCDNINGIVNNTWIDDGTYYNNEQDGAGYNTTFNFTLGPNNCLSRLTWNGRYDGGVATGLRYYVWNWSSGAFQPLTTNYIDVGRSATDNNYEVTGCHPDYLNDTTGEVYFRFAAVDRKVGDEMYFDYLVMANDAGTYSVQNEIVSCNKTQYYYAEPAELVVERHDSLITALSAFFMLLGVYLIVGSAISFLHHRRATEDEVF